MSCIHFLPKIWDHLHKVIQPWMLVLVCDQFLFLPSVALSNCFSMPLRSSTQIENLGMLRSSKLPSKLEEWNDVMDLGIWERRLRPLWPPCLWHMVCPVIGGVKLEVYWRLYHKTAEGSFFPMSGLGQALLTSDGASFSKISEFLWTSQSHSSFELPCGPMGFPILER